VARRTKSFAKPLIAPALAVAAALMTTSGLDVAGQDLDVARPERHFRVERPARLSPGDARVVYERIAGDMVAGYRLSRDPAARRYRKWRQYNRAPYRSATHGNRYVNNYANPIGADAYGRFEKAGEMPEGTIIAKDSFAVTAQGDVFTGPLFLMEKMPAGFSPATANWRYSMIMPDGSYFGVTKGDHAERVAFCATCHKTAGEADDHLFFVPADNRRRIFDLDALTD